MNQMATTNQTSIINTQKIKRNSSITPKKAMTSREDKTSEGKWWITKRTGKQQNDNKHILINNYLNCKCSNQKTEGDWID